MLYYTYIPESGSLVDYCYKDKECESTECPEGHSYGKQCSSGGCRSKSKKNTFFPTGWDIHIFKYSSYLFDTQ